MNTTATFKFGTMGSKEATRNRVETFDTPQKRKPNNAVSLPEFGCQYISSYAWLGL